MTFITRSLPLNLDHLLLGVVEPPDWELNPRIGPGKTSGRDLSLFSRVMNANTVVVCIEMGLVGLC